MATKKEFFSSAYQIETQDDINSLYTNWANSYDNELRQMGYRSPIRCAAALGKFVSIQTPILDFGCGTGLSGYALKKIGFKKIFGTEINENMRNIAQQKKIYARILETDIDSPFPLGKQFNAICAVGVISSGAGPPSLLRESLNCLREGGFICFSYNDHTLNVRAYMDAISSVTKSGDYKEVFCEYGDHLISKGLGSAVYVLQKRT